MSNTKNTPTYNELINSSPFKELIVLLDPKEQQEVEKGLKEFLDAFDAKVLIPLDSIHQK